MTIEALPFEHRPRNSIANNLDKINELVDWANLDTHLYASATGERVTVDDASSVKSLTVDGRSVQDGTPTPDAPVPVLVVGGKNLLPLTAQTVTNRRVTATVDTTGTVTITGTATGGNAALTIPVASDVPLANNVDYTAQRITVSGSLDGTFYIRGIDDDNQSMHHLFNLANVTERTSRFANNAIVQTIYIVVQENTTIDCVLNVQVEQGSTATSYTPYGSIGIVVGDTATSIDLQGNMLASLPDGTRDELHIDSAGHVWIDKRVGHTTQAVTDGVTGTVGTDVLSSTGQIADGADVWYKLATTQAIDLGYITPPAIPSGSVVTISASLTPTIHLEWWMDDGITALVDDLIAYIAYIDYKTEG